MLLRILLTDNTLAEKMLILLIYIAALVPALVLHEWAHGYAAYKLGDHTAKLDGRLSLNPLNHLDPLGAIMLLLFGFGWAKPVPVFTRNFKNARRDLAITSAAGPLMNFFVAFVSAFVVVLSNFIMGRVVHGEIILWVVYNIFYYLMLMNIGLGLFNLIPIPPLDGSNILICMLSPNLAAKYARLRYYTRYILIGLLLLTWLPGLGAASSLIFAPLELARTGIMNLFIGFWKLFF